MELRQNAASLFGGAYEKTVLFEGRAVGVTHGMLRRA